jgi:hypothetical protein
MEDDLSAEQYGYHPLTLNFYDAALRAKFKEFVVNSPSDWIQFTITLILFLYSASYLALCAIYFDPSVVSPFTGPHRFLWTVFYILCNVVSSLSTVSYALEYSVGRLSSLLRWDEPRVIKLAATVRSYYGALNSLPTGMSMCLRSLVRCPNSASSFTQMYCNGNGKGAIPVDQYFFLVTFPLILHAHIATEWYAPFTNWAVGLFFLIVSMWLSADGETLLLWSYWPVPSFMSILFFNAYCLMLLVHYSIQTKLMLKFIVHMQKQNNMTLAHTHNMLAQMHWMRSGASYTSDRSGHTSCDSNSISTDENPHIADWNSNEEDVDGSTVTLSTHATSGLDGNE